MPEAISRFVLVEWVRFDRLESALYNRELRKQFHALVLAQYVKTGIVLS
jgi:hypothetical protein